MFGRKSKSSPEQGRDRLRTTTPGASSPAFSYYASRTPELGNRPQRVLASEQSGRRLPKTLISQLPFWLLLVVVVICAAKLLLLTTNPKIILLGKNSVSASYLQPASTYQAAAQKLLGSSLTNRTKITANLDGTAAAMRQKFPELQAVSLTLPLVGNRPVIYVQAAQPSVLVQSIHGNYALNKSGLVLAKVAHIPSGVPLVVDQSGVALHPGKRYLPGSTIGFVQTLSYQLTAAHLAVSAFILPSGSPYELDARLEGKPFVIRCNLQAEALVQSGAAIATLQHLGSGVPAAYLDVRTPDRVYYR
ncbi:MAG TPA: hypothetical protein VLF69_03360 [Candidatus Saccharimonadales bacterium]|nr:hypothetical protein [Candidatus Saccharimonadales bacterium]